MGTCYAHSAEGRPRHEWQPLEEHLGAVASRAAEFASKFSSADWAYNAGWLHDLGKAADEFQAYLLRENGLDDSDYDVPGNSRVNHSSAGAALGEEKLGAHAGRVLAYLVAGHHAGLPDWDSADTGRAALHCRLEDGVSDLGRIRSFADTACGGLRNVIRPPQGVKPDNLHLWVRMLFSCLVDADFLDTERFMNPGSFSLRGGFSGLVELKRSFDAHMEHKTAGARKTDVNAIRCEVLAACRVAAQHPPGLYSLTVPTGGGKTLSGMAFALDHAVRHGKCRIIYVIPYTSIIEQTAQILADIFGPGNVVEHHSNLNPERETQRSRLASENWDAPVIVTTNVQFFESLYAAQSSRCRKLHNIADSVVILDEAQLLPPELISPCVDVMNQLTRHYGVTIVLSTATQPALSALPEGCHKLDYAREIMPDPADLYARLKRTELVFPPSLQVTTDWASLARDLQKHDQVLCVVNTRRDCYDLFNLMPKGTFHLSALMCGAHRSRIIRIIKWLLRKGRPVRVVSTQLVEAGVDIDFPVVYRALAGLDSIAQAGGRCNREGGLDGVGQVHVFVPPKPAPRGLLRKGEDTTREMCACDGVAAQGPGTFSRYFQLFYSKVNDTGRRFRDWLVRDVNPGMSIQFRTAARDFNLIDDQAQRAVVVRYGETGELLARLRYSGPTRDLMRQLQRYTVNVPARMADRMLADGLLEEIGAKKSGGVLAQCGLNLYDDRVGLEVYRETLPVEDLVQ